MRLGFIANPVLDRRKGFDSINGALGVLERAGYDLEVHIFGRISRAQRCAVGGAETHYHGTFGPADLPQVYGSFDILLCPSRLDNSPNVVCEALAWGCPVVAQADTGVESYISENTGRLVDFGGFRHGASKTQAEAAQEDFLRAISEIVKDFESFSTAASQYARRELAFDKIGTAYMRLYEEIMQGMCPA
jgi:glycosyltransferase involved in cell wall biosynthesis